MRYSRLPGTAVKEFARVPKNREHRSGLPAQPSFQKPSSIDRAREKGAGPRHSGKVLYDADQGR